MRQKTWTDEQLIEAVRTSISVSAVIRALGLAVTGGNFQHMKAQFCRLGLDTSHFKGRGYLKGQHHSFSKPRPLSEILTRNSSFSRTKLRQRLIKEGLLREKCSSCGINEWMGKRLTLELHHINGTSDDNRIENLCLLCPNCHSQTENHSGKSKRTRQMPAHRCRCGKRLRDRRWKRCESCYHADQKTTSRSAT
jgi:hypothetical protein